MSHACYTCVRDTSHATTAAHRRYAAAPSPPLHLPLLTLPKSNHNSLQPHAASHPPPPLYNYLQPGADVVLDVGRGRGARRPSCSTQSKCNKMQQWNATTEQHQVAVVSFCARSNCSAQSQRPRRSTLPIPALSTGRSARMIELVRHQESGSLF